MNNVKMTSERFFDYYGDCYISDMCPRLPSLAPGSVLLSQANSSARFMEGGDLHGIVSIKVLDASKKSQVEAAYVSIFPLF
jgi:hypothetical protein